MFTDMVDYTGLSEKDEPLALALLDEHRHLLRPVFSKHSGREVKTLGDGFLVEFASALEAVRCGLELQQMISGRNQKVPSERRILLRVGVHLGDVEHRDGDIYGDAVNIASRVQELADPGGVWITQQVYDNIRNSREFESVSLGQSQLKNVQTPVEIYKIQPATSESSSSHEDTLETRRVAALPLTILSSDQQDEYFADGLTEEIINTLSSISGLRVIARTSVMKYKQARKSVSEIGRELRVGTILEGSVRKAGARVRVTVQLIDVGSETPVWAQKYDREMKNVFEIQMDIAERVAEALKVRLLTENRRIIDSKAPEDIAAFVLYLRGRYYWSKRNKADLERAIGQFEQAVHKDPGYALAYAGLADCYTLMGRHRYLPPDDVFPKAREYAEKALRLNDSLAEAHSALAAVLLIYNWDWKAAENQFTRALELNPNYATAHYWYSVLLLTIGKLREAVTEAEKAQALDPLSPVVGMGVVDAYYFSGQYERAIEECNKYLEMEPNFIRPRDLLVHLHANKKSFEEAERAARRLAETSERKAEAAAHLPYVLAASGRTEEARALIEKIVKDPKLNYTNSTIFIAIYSILGDQENAFRWATKAVDEAKISFPSIRFSPDLNEFRKDARYSALLRDVHLE
jgi:TolB-like protein/Tfp pilus assembly protein PilF